MSIGWRVLWGLSIIGAICGTHWLEQRKPRPAAPVGQACTVYVVKPETVYVSVTGLREYRLYRQGVKSIRVFEFTEQPARAGGKR